MHRQIILGGLCASIFLTSCQEPRQHALREYKAETKRLTTEIKALDQELQIVVQQRNDAREQVQRMQEQLTGAQVQLQSLSGTAFVDVHDDHVSIDGLAFRSGSARLTAEASLSIKQLARQLSQGWYAQRQIVVLGHTDNEPMRNRLNRDKFGDNWGLSAMRAASVVRVFIEAGVNPDRIQGAFAGEHRPRTSNADKDGRRQNRRVEVYLR